MLLAVDVGNTQTALGLYEDEQLGEHWRLATELQRTGDELGVCSPACSISTRSTGSASPPPCRR